MKLAKEERESGAVRSFTFRARLASSELALTEHACLRPAGRFFEPRLRSLDAIHLMAALEPRPIEAFVSYDHRQIGAARDAGCRPSPRA